MRLGTRLFAAIALVVAAGAGTLLAVALLVAPRLFHAHLDMALGSVSPAVLEHVDVAFTRAILLSLALAASVATLAALAVTWLVARRIAVPVTGLATAVGRLAAGHLDTRVAEPGLGPEFAALAQGFNVMAARLAGTERVRQRMLADLAHELRTPLASVEATIEAVADGVLPADAGTWATLAEQTGRLNRLVEDLAVVSRAMERALNPDLRTVPVAELTAAAAAAVRARYATGEVTLEVVADPVRTLVRVDPQRIGEALANLLDNALRHTPPGGRVTITTGRTRRLDHDLALIDITDTGQGFDPADAERLFERFYRADPARTHHGAGSGIGLTISRTILNAHGGTIHARSDGPGHGATFHLTLPVAA